MGEAKNIYFTCLKYKIEKLLFLSRETWARRKFFGRCRCSGVRRRRRPWPTAKVAKASSRSMADLSISSNRARSVKSWRSPCCCWARTVSRRWTFAFASTAAVTSLKSTPFVKPFPSLWWLIIRNTWTKLRRRRPRTFSRDVDHDLVTFHAGPDRPGYVSLLALHVSTWQRFLSPSELIFITSKERTLDTVFVTFEK